MDVIKEYEFLGFIQGDGTLTYMLTHCENSILINIGKDDHDLISYFDLKNICKKSSRKKKIVFKQYRFSK